MLDPETSVGLFYQYRRSYVPEGLNLQTTTVRKFNYLCLIILRPRLFYSDDSFPCVMDFPDHSDETPTKSCLFMQNTSLTDWMSPKMGKNITVNQIWTLCTRFSTAISDYSRNNTTAVASLKTGIPPHNAQSNKQSTFYYNSPVVGSCKHGNEPAGSI